MARQDSLLFYLFFLEMGKQRDAYKSEGLTELRFWPFCLQLCDLEEVTSPLCALVSSSVTWE